MFLLTEKVALVTGGSSGIGRATAIAFAQAGANVVVASRRLEEGEQTVQLIQQLGREALFVQTDVIQEAQVKVAIAATVERFGRLDYAFNNAGIEQDAQPLIEQTEATFDRIMDINVKGVWLCLKYQVAQMLKNGGGAIVNNTSMADSVGFPGVPVYVASKHAVLGLTRAIALELCYVQYPHQCRESWCSKYRNV
jgi:NAD(P)-dependent dehydrogenase (short-subunit alcohol dehydrogenase family)